ncbi:MAG: DUF4148 domain-containing protein [Bacteroidales bacterium]|nr:DUF4148 domain-containing protein [Bacteroidales bacterium]
MKKQMKTKALVLSLAMAAVMALPTMAMAQEGRSNHSGLFGTNQSKEAFQGGMIQNSTRGVDITLNAGDITNQGVGETTPLGSGLVILLGAGLGYVALKKKED